MKQFEYMTKRVAFFKKNPHENGGDYSALECLTPPSLVFIGQEGWELVQVVSYPRAIETEIGLYAIFKREKGE